MKIISCSVLQAFPKGKKIPRKTIETPRITLSTIAVSGIVVYPQSIHLQTIIMFVE